MHNSFNHPNRKPVTAVYARDQSGTLTRNVVDMSAARFLAENSHLGEVAETEQLKGWPESRVEWYGNTGIGRR
jgi:hypothetical protein